jgi:murein DD-endopeptidase MepM/ murein hydrolase activator NlpD
MLLRFLLALLLALIASPVLAAEKFDARQQGAELTVAFYDGRIDAVWERMNPQMQAALKSRDGLAAFRAQLDAQLGPETAIVDEKTTSEQGFEIYDRRARFQKIPMVILVHWAFDAEHKVAGFFIRPDQSAAQVAAPSAYLDYQTRSALRLPFVEEFYVFWGGRSIEQNYHAAHPNQRFALDMMIVRGEGTHAGEGRRNEDYYCFGTPILAPAAGKVLQVIDNVDDNVPGQMNSAQVTGNRIVLDHGNGEYSVLAHLRRGSVRVHEGQSVQAGDQLGECGNSGNSSEPHLHFQLQDGPKFGESAGLPAQFSNYLADGQPVARGEPTKGQRIRPAIHH